MRRLLAAAVAVAGLLAAVAAAPGQTAKPKLLPGRDPGGVAVALIGPGIDYRHAAIADRLARDGEGEVIGWDFTDDDRHPFEPATSGEGTVLAAIILKEAPAARLVPLRVAANDGLALARAVVHAAHGPARIVVVPILRADNWEPVRQAAQHFAHILFVVAGGEDLARDKTLAAVLELPNVLSVADADRAAGVDLAVPADTAAAAAARVAALAARLLAAAPVPDGAALKQRVVGLATPMPGEKRTRAGFIADPARVTPN